MLLQKERASQSVVGEEGEPASDDDKDDNDDDNDNDDTLVKEPLRSLIQVHVTFLEHCVNLIFAVLHYLFQAPHYLHRTRRYLDTSPCRCSNPSVDVHFFAVRLPSSPCLSSPLLFSLIPRLNDGNPELKTGMDRLLTTPRKIRERKKKTLARLLVTRKKLGEKTSCCNGGKDRERVTRDSSAGNTQST
jgi:hypothetical protein